MALSRELHFTGFENLGEVLEEFRAVLLGLILRRQIADFSVILDRSTNPGGKCLAPVKVIIAKFAVY